jgi:hypothetical protein
VNNNPTNYVDLTGHALCDDMGNCYLRQGESIPTQNQYRFVTNIIRNKLDLSEGKTSTIQSSSQAAVNAYVDNVFNGSNNGSNIANTNPINNDTNISQSIIDPSSVLFWLSMNVNWIWRHSPTFLQGVFSDTERRIISIDHPHLGSGEDCYYHLNSDLKFANGINHKNIEPFIKTLIGFANSYTTTVLSLTESFAPFIIITDQQLKNLPGIPSNRQY